MMLLIVGVVFVTIVFFWFVVYKYGHHGNTLAEVSTSFQNIAIVLSIVGGAIWAFHTFDILNKKEKAEAELAEIQRRIENTASTNIGISTVIVDYKGPYQVATTKGLIVEVKIKNQGKSKLTFDLAKKPLKIYKIEAQGIKMGYKDVLEPVLYSKLASGVTANGDREKNTPLDTFISLSSSERVLSYFVTVDINSMYYIVFAPEIGEVKEVETECVDNTCKWFVSKYIFIEPLATLNN